MHKFNNLKKSCSKYTTAKVIDIVSESYGYSPGFERPMIMNFPILEFMFNDKMVTKKYMYTSSKKEQYEIGKEYKYTIILMMRICFILMEIKHLLRLERFSWGLVQYYWYYL